jgi:hypothetical protein
MVGKVKIRAKTILVMLSLVAPASYADWHGGKVTQMNIGYEGNMITFVLEGWSRNDCTCYPTWPGSMCLNRNRLTYKEEVAMLLSARARGTGLFANIDEATCSVVALYEAN